ncbi:MAG: hypothetical protein KGK01_16105 [Bradyrhizobium sp.]|uniref:hypothetical protein n=1 Tax=Bradyrhizobium sp. TaxID=376 RepID=UPI0023887B84|nr:hypothetical protein [Bradyrhizobium sp.]MDE2069521.1 hypothetical protein [Bradyrhizobium sp.]MDE2243890.1 hypothetical protein [Bradyrhizobium sp.]
MREAPNQLFYAVIMPEFKSPTPFWLDVAAVVALGGAIILLFYLRSVASAASRQRADRRADKCGPLSTVERMLTIFASLDARRGGG